MGKKSGADTAPGAVEMQPLDGSAPKSKMTVAYDTTGNPRPSVELAANAVRMSRELLDIKHKEAAGGQLSKKEKETRSNAKDLKKELDMDEHIIPLADLCTRYQTSTTRGLDSAMVPELLKKFGNNELTPPKSTPEIIKFLKQMTGFFSLLLWVGGLLCFVSVMIDSSQTSNAYLGGVLWFVVFITGVFTYLQEAQSSKVMEGFKKLVPAQTVVRRNGKEEDINARFIVPGDVVFVKAGDKVPADIRVFEQSNMKVDNSSLTGESEPQSRGIENTHENPLETKVIAFGSTLVLEGQGFGIVIRTADNTLIGRIAGLASGTAAVETPIHKEIGHFVTVISAIAIFLGLTFLILGFVIGRDPVDNVVFMIGIIVANVPEGLLATVTVSLTLTANRMKQKAVLVKHLESVETLGSTTTICSDKTGTLTQNNMSVAAVFYDDRISAVNTLLDNDTQGEFDVKSTSFKSLHRCGALCNKTTFDTDKEGEFPNSQLPVRKRRCIGDASETAIVKFCQPLRDINVHREANPRVAILPFNSANKWMATVHKLEDGDPRALVLVKGAPERVLDRCKFVLHEGRQIPITPEIKARIYQGNEDLASRGMRVLGFAESFLDAKQFPPTFEYEVEPKPNFPVENMTFIGLFALIDPPRAGVPEAVLKCHRAGIRVIMVTGDQPTTAKAIAQQVNIIKSDTVEDIARREGIPKERVDPRRAKAIVVHGSQISGAKDGVGLKKEEWDAILLHHQEIVFARTSPQQKLVIVDECQKRGMIVAVTGDGVNDSPALKKADIGVAMGISGSDVSKEAADMILMDDNFASIVNGIEEGRLIFDNLKKSIAYTLSSNIPEITPFLMFIICRIPLPLTTVLILTIDLGTDMIPAISLAYETKEADIMSRPPRDAKIDRLVTFKLISFSYFQIGVIQALAGFYVYFVVFDYYEIPLGALFDQDAKLGDNWGVSKYTAFCWEDTSYIGNTRCELKEQTTDSTTSCAGSAPTNYTAAGTKGAVYCYDKCTDILQEAQTAFLVTIVIVQYADLVICKTRKLSILQQGMRNGVLNFGLLFETLLMVFLCYTPFINDTVFLTYPMRIEWWFAALPFCMFIFLYDEFRKFIIRGGRIFDYGDNEKVTNPFSRWLYETTYW